MAPRIGPYRGRAWASTIAVAVQPAEREQRQAAEASAAGGLTLDGELYPPPGSAPLILGDQALSPGLGQQVLFSRKLAKGQEAALRQLTVLVDSPILATRATWQVLVNGVVVPGLDAVSMLFRAASSLAVSFDTLRVKVPDGGSIAVAVTNVDGAPRVYGAQLVGWTKPVQTTKAAAPASGIAT